MYMRFVVQQLCMGLLYKVQNPDLDPDKAITGLGLLFSLGARNDQIIQQEPPSHMCQPIAPVPQVSGPWHQ